MGHDFQIVYQFMDIKKSLCKVDFGTMLGVVWIKCTKFLGPIRFVMKHSLLHIVPFCNPNIIANNKERCFRNPVVANHNSSQILKLLRYHNIRTRTIASPSELLNLIQSQNFSDYNCFYPLFAINITLETICNKPITATTYESTQKSIDFPYKI